MNLDSEYLPATGAAKQDLVLLHGWGSNREIWRPLLASLRCWANVTLVDLPGCAPEAGVIDNPDLQATLQATLQALLQCAPPTAVYVGWSLGGQLAIELASHHPARVAAVVTVCSNPKFVAAGDWPGMNADDFASFRAGFTTQPQLALRRFDSMQAQGSQRQRQLLRQLQQLRRCEPGKHLAAGLDWLAALDQRAQLTRLVPPQLHILGGSDPLVPPALGESLRELLGSRHQTRIVTLPDLGHLAPLESPGLLAQHIEDFLGATVTPRPVREPECGVSKADVASSFSRSASLYDSVAGLQRDVGTQLLASLESVESAPDTVLDLGCGTGFFYPELKRRFPLADYIGIDLAQGMVEYARRRYPQAGTWLVGDAEALPLASHSVDLVFSSLAIQWCYRPGHLFAELARILKPGGRCVFTSLGPDTLQELRSAWAAVDAHRHVNTFLSPADLATAAGTLPGVSLELRGECFRMEYQRVRDLLLELKTLGAHNMNRERLAGLTGRRALQGMLAAYEDWRQDGMLPATYDVIFGILEKT